MEVSPAQSDRASLAEMRAALDEERARSADLKRQLEEATQRRNVAEMVCHISSISELRC